MFPLSLAVLPIGGLSFGISGVSADAKSSDFCRRRDIVSTIDLRDRHSPQSFDQRQLILPVWESNNSEEDGYGCHAICTMRFLVVVCRRGARRQEGRIHRQD